MATKPFGVPFNMPCDLLLHPLWPQRTFFSFSILWRPTIVGNYMPITVHGTQSRYHTQDRAGQVHNRCCRSFGFFFLHFSQLMYVHRCDNLRTRRTASNDQPNASIENIVGGIHRRHWSILRRASNSQQIESVQFLLLASFCNEPVMTCLCVR